MYAVSGSMLNRRNRKQNETEFYLLLACQGEKHHWKLLYYKVHLLVLGILFSWYVDVYVLASYKNMILLELHLVYSFH